MRTQLIPQVSVTNGVPMTTSRAVASYFGKEHNKVLRSVRNLECSQKFSQDNFRSAKYLIIY